MHFWVSATRFHGAAWSPRKYGTNWFMPAFVNSRFGAVGIRDDDGTMACCFDLKKSRNDWRISAEVMRWLRVGKQSTRYGVARRKKWRRVAVCGSAVPPPIVTHSLLKPLLYCSRKWRKNKKFRKTTRPCKPGWGPRSKAIAAGSASPRRN